MTDFRRSISIESRFTLDDSEARPAIANIRQELETLDRTIQSIQTRFDALAKSVSGDMVRAHSVLATSLREVTTLNDNFNRSLRETSAAQASSSSTTFGGPPAALPSAVGGGFSPIPSGAPGGGVLAPPASSPVAPPGGTRVEDVAPWLIPDTSPTAGGGSRLGGGIAGSIVAGGVAAGITAYGGGGLGDIATAGGAGLLAGIGQAYAPVIQNRLAQTSLVRGLGSVGGSLAGGFTLAAGGAAAVGTGLALAPSLYGLYQDRQQLGRSQAGLDSLLSDSGFGDYDEFVMRNRESQIRASVSQAFAPSRGRNARAFLGGLANNEISAIGGSIGNAGLIGDFGDRRDFLQGRLDQADELAFQASRDRVGATGQNQIRILQQQLAARQVGDSAQASIFRTNLEEIGGKQNAIGNVIGLFDSLDNVDKSLLKSGQVSPERLLGEGGSLRLNRSLKSLGLGLGDVDTKEERTAVFNDLEGQAESEKQKLFNLLEASEDTNKKLKDAIVSLNKNQADKVTAQQQLDATNELILALRERAKQQAQPARRGRNEVRR